MRRKTCLTWSSFHLVRFLSLSLGGRGLSKRRSWHAGSSASSGSWTCWAVRLLLYLLLTIHIRLILKVNLSKLLILSFVLDKFVWWENLIYGIFGLLLLLGSINVMLECLMEWLMIPSRLDVCQKLLINCLSHHGVKLIVDSEHVVCVVALALR